MSLQSQLFRGDPQLEAAAVSAPAHITPGASGEHVRKIQVALIQLDGAAIVPDGYYGSSTANAVLAYKKKRNIINWSYQTHADNIVGRMTIASLDREMVQSKNPIRRVVYAGVHREPYPTPTGNTDTMEWLIDHTNLRWCGFYLAPTPSHTNKSWMDKRDRLKKMGWGFAPIYLGQQEHGLGNHFPSKTQGKIDGQDAVRLARNAGFPASSTLYLDIEGSPPFTKLMIDYYQAWVLAVIDGTFWPGVYCSPFFAATLVAANPAPIVPTIWSVIFHRRHPSYKNPYPEKPPASSGYPLAQVWQYDGDTNIQGPNGTLYRYDLDSSYTNDPSNVQVFLASA